MNLAAHRTTGRAIIATLLAGAFFIAGHHAGFADHRERTTVTVPCAEEDDQGEGAACYWDAASRGNGGGKSFIKWPDGSIEYMEGR